MPPAGGSTPSLLKFAGRVGWNAEQIFVAHGGGLHPSLQRVVVVHAARDVQADSQPEQHADGMRFWTRDLLTRQWIQTANALRGHLAEHSVVAP